MKRKSSTLLMAGTLGVAILAFGTVGLSQASEVNIQIAGLDVSIANEDNKGFTIEVNGAQCPGAGCPAIALDWSPAKRG